MRSKRATYNIICNLILQIITLIYGFIVPKIIITHYGSSINGLVSSITQFLGYITLLESGVGPVIKAALYKPIAKKNDKEIMGLLLSSERFFRNIAKIFLVYIVLLLVFYPFIIAKEYDYFFTASLIIIIAVSTFAEYYFGMTYKLLIQANQRSYIISIIQTITYIVAAFMVIVFSKANITIHTLKLLCTIIFIFRPLLQGIYVKKIFEIKIPQDVKPVAIKQKWDGMAQHIANVIHNGTDVTLLSIFCSFEEVSVYSAYALVIKGIKAVITAFTNGMDSIFGEMLAKEEKDNLNSKFNLYETIYLCICNIIFSCTLVLITPFIKVYTSGFSDANYIRYTFAILLVIGEYIWAIRLPYNSITMSAGKFKETKVGAWVESFLNVIVSLIFIRKYGIIGVTIGTISAMLYRTVELIVFSQKNVLFRKIRIAIKKVLLVIANTIIISIIYYNIPLHTFSSYMTWALNAIIVFVISSIEVGLSFGLLYFSDIKMLFNYIKSRIWERKK